MKGNLLKIIWAGIAILLLSLHKYNPVQTVITDLKEMHLAGNVKSMTEIIYKPLVVESGDQGKNVRQETICHFNRDGNITDESFFTEWGDPVRTMDSVFFDEQGRRAFRLTYNSKNELIRKTGFVCNNEAAITERLASKPDGSFAYKKIYTYDERGNLKSITDYSKSGDESGKTTYSYKYDPQGYILERKVTYLPDTSVYRTTYQVDNRGNSIVQQDYHPSGKLVKSQTMEYDYDAAGNWIRRRVKFKVGGTGIIRAERKIQYY